MAGPLCSGHTSALFAVFLVWLALGAAAIYLLTTPQHTSNSTGHNNKKKEVATSA